MATSKTSEIILGRVEHINASHFNCLSFTKVSDVVNGFRFRQIKHQSQTNIEV